MGKGPAPSPPFGAAGRGHRAQVPPDGQPQPSARPATTRSPYSCSQTPPHTVFRDPTLLAVHIKIGMSRTNQLSRSS